MVKEASDNSRESGVKDQKKRRKASGPATSTLAKTPKVDVYKEVMEFEEQEALTRPPDKDMVLFQDTCEEIRQTMKDILNLKLKKRSEQTLAELAEKRISASLQFVILKKLNRLEKFRTKKSRDTTNEAKQRVDSFHLQLQNLLYEVMHLKKEVTKCLEFKSKDEEIKLVPVEEFYRDAPDSLTQREATELDSHQLKLSRLEWELEQRKQLAAQCHELVVVKEAVAKEITVKQEYLDNLAPRLDSILEATKPLQDYLGLPLDMVRAQHTMARHLPKPLYILYIQSTAYQEACDDLLTVTVCGDLDDARTLLNSADQTEVEDTDSEQENEQQEESGNRQKRRHGRRTSLSKADRLEEKKKKVLRKHPLWVEMVVKMQDGNSITLKYFYLLVLHIITVKCKLNLNQTGHSNLYGNHGASASPESTRSSKTESSHITRKESTKSFNKESTQTCKHSSQPPLKSSSWSTCKDRAPAENLDLLSADSLLSCLFPHDLGKDTPNVANHYQLKQFGLDDFQMYISEVGQPYIWAQWLGGLDFMITNINMLHGLQETETEKEQAEGLRASAIVRPVHGVSANHMELTIRAVRQRVCSRIALQKQVTILEREKSVSVPVEMMSQFPSKISSRLSSWRTVAWDDYKMATTTQYLVQEGLVSEVDTLFRAVIDRGSAKLITLVAVKPDYPKRVPVFSLNLHWHGERNSMNDDVVRDMERELNVHWTEFLGSRDFLLSNQLQRLLVCLDICLESECALGLSGPDRPHQEFSREKIFFKPVKGRTRSRPFKYLPRLGIFTQR